MIWPCAWAGYKYDGAVMITASHLPFNRNGFKFFTAAGGFEKGDISTLLAAAAAEHAAEDAPNPRPGGRYADDAFVLSSALHNEPGLIEYVRARPLSVFLSFQTFLGFCQTLYANLLTRRGGAQHAPRGVLC